MTRLALVAATLIVAAFAVTIERAPISWADETIYASIARSLQLGRGGVPSVDANPPVAVDHVRFYGPVFFSLAALSFQAFGVSLASFRVISLAGALIVAAAAAVLCAAFGSDRRQHAWAFVLLLLTPELGTSATNGRMDSLAVGLALLGLGVAVHAFARATAPVLHGFAAGALLAAAALTTPRTLPFLGAFVLGASAVMMSRDARRAVPLLVATLGAIAVVLACWAWFAYRGPLDWVHTLRSIASGTGVDVAISTTAARDWRLSPWTVISPILAAFGGLSAVVTLVRDKDTERTTVRMAAWLAIAVCAINLIAVVTLFNGTFAFGTYGALPLFAVVVAFPWQWTAPSRASWSTAFAAILVVDAALRSGKYVGVAATWRSRDPRPLEAFVHAHVPPGSDVLGDPAFYFYAVERAGSRMVSASAGGFPEWTAVVRRDAIANAPPVPERIESRRAFLLWPSQEDDGGLPPGLECAAAHLVATYQPPAAQDVTWGRAFAARLVTNGYPQSRLYELPSGCRPRTP